MTTIALPAGLCARDFSLALNVVQRVSSSPYSGSEQVVDLLNDRWAISMTLPARRSGDGAAVEAFIASLRGMTNTVNLWHMQRPVPRGTMRGTPLSDPGVQGANTMVIGSMTPGATLLAGDLIGINGLLLMIAQDSVANGLGQMTITMVNRLRKTITVGTPVIWDRPTAPFRLASSVAVQYVPGYSPEVSLDFLEAIS